MNIKRIKENTIINENMCWIWIKSKTSSGYGQLTENKKYWSAHRYSYIVTFGEIPNNLIIRHKCHNKSCCNPNHLELGSHLDNYNDSKDIHIKNNDDKKHKWIIEGQEYFSSREAVKKTGISIHSIIKFTKEGLFNHKEYEKACAIAGWKPKIKVD